LAAKFQPNSFGDFWVTIGQRSRKEGIGKSRGAVGGKIVHDGVTLSKMSQQVEGKA
jgi:hypothetical protein